MNRSTKIVLGFILLSIFALQMGMILGPTPKATVIVEQHDNSLKREISQPFIDSERNFVIHFTSNEYLNEFLINNEPKHVFHHVKMVFVDEMLSKKEDLQSLPGVEKVIDVTNTRFHTLQPIKDTTNTPESIKHTVTTAGTINVSGLWSEGYDGKNTIIMIIDTGINQDHVDFEDRINTADSKSFVLSQYGYPENDPSIDDIGGHGTHVAGTAAGAGIANPDYIGMAPSAEIIVGRVGRGDRSSRDVITNPGLVASFDYAISLDKVDAINLSIGGGDREGEDLLERVIREATESGITVASSAGNSGMNGYYSVGSPSTAADCIAVAALDLTNSRAYFSSIGPSADGFPKPDIAAPGVNIWAPYIDSSTAYASLQGTSMASPHIAGATNVLIQALNAETISYDPGLIKAAMMVTATQKPTENYLTFGAGIADIGDAFHAVKTAPTNGSGFPVLMWAVPEMPVEEYYAIPQGFHAELYVQSVSSTPDEDLPPVLTGNITEIVSLLNTTSASPNWTKNYQLVIDVPDEIALGVYSGIITFATAEGVTVETYLEFEVIRGIKKVFYAKMHTNWGSDHYLGQYRYFIDGLKDLGIAVNSYTSGTITSDLLDGYDMIWFADPFNLQYPNFPSSYSETHNPLTESEIDAIHNFVENGGGLYVNLLGRHYSTDYGLVFGNNISMTNELLKPYGVSVSGSYYSTDMDVVTASTTNIHAITEDVKKIDHYGTVLNEIGNSTVLSSWDGKPVASAWESPIGSRVVVSTTNFHIDTAGFINDYNPGTQNDLFGLQTFKWLTANNRTTGSYIETSTGVDFNITFNPPEIFYQAYVHVTDGTGTITTTNVDLTEDSTGQYSYSLIYDQDGSYTFEVITEDDKYLAKFMYDKTAPSVSYTEGFENNTVTDLTTIEFTIFDEMGLSSVKAILNDESLAVTRVTSQTYTVSIFEEDLIEGSNILEITATDKTGNKLEVTYIIKKAEETEEGYFGSIGLFIGLAAISVLVIHRRRKKR